MFVQPFIIYTLTIIKFTNGISKHNKTEIIKLIDDFLNLQKSPLKINSFICWNQHDSIQLLKKLTPHYHMAPANFQNPLKFNVLSEHQLFLLDSSCHNTAEILKLANKRNFLNPPFTWIILGDSSLFSDFYLGVGSKIYLIKQSDREVYKIKSIYKYTENSTKLIENEIASWSPDKKFSTYNELMIPRNRSNLMGEKIKISYVVTNLDSLNHLWDYRDRHIDAITKLNYILVHHLTDFMNCSKEFIMQPTWGYKNATTGIYSGEVGDLQQGFAELGSTPMFFTLDRVDVVDFIAATTPTFMRFIFRAPPLSYVTNVFTLPFDTTVWHCSFVLVAIILAVVYVIVIWEWRDPKFRQKIEDKYTALRPKLFDVVMMEIGAISQQGTDVEPKSYAGRIATIFTFVALMFMYTSYSANIVALLQSTTDSIKTLEDLLNSRIKLGVEDIVYAHYYFKTAQEPTKKAIYEQKIAPKGQKPNFMTVEEGIRRVQQGFFGFHVELTTGYKVVGDIFQENEKCSLKEIEFVNVIEPWMTARKNSPLKKIMKVGMQKIRESGLQRREMRRLYTRKPVCHSRGSNFGSVGLIDCYSAFLIFAIGIFIAVLFLLLEVIIMRYTLRQTSQTEELDVDIKDNKSNKTNDIDSVE